MPSFERVLRMEAGHIIATEPSAASVRGSNITDKSGSTREILLRMIQYAVEVVAPLIHAQRDTAPRALSLSTAEEGPGRSNEQYAGFAAEEVAGFVLNSVALIADICNRASMHTPYGNGCHHDSSRRSLQVASGSPLAAEVEPDSPQPSRRMMCSAG
jgi:hypothetical protein